MISPVLFALKAQVKNSTYALLDELGLEGWVVDFDRSLARSGQCRYGQKVIVYSIPFLETSSPEERMNTIRHEVAHAMTGPNHGHDEVWAANCQRLGGTASVVALQPQKLATHKYFLWVGTCGNCNYRHGIMDAPDGVWICGACAISGKSQFERLFHWSCDGEPVAPEELGELYNEQFKSVVSQQLSVV